jgi:hypothetical protein
MPPKSEKSENDYSEAETKRRAEAALKRMLNTSHKPHTPLKAKKKSSRPKSASPKPRKKA